MPEHIQDSYVEIVEPIKSLKPELQTEPVTEFHPKPINVCQGLYNLLA